MVSFYVLTSALAFWVTFGPAAGLYSVLYQALPVFSFLRAPARMGIIVTLCLAVFSALAVSRLAEGRRRRGWIAAALCVLAVADLAQVPLGLRDARPVPEAYKLLATLPRGPVAVFPFWARSIDFHGHAEFLLASAAHWQPLINGYGDHIPQDFRDNAPTLRGFPSRDAFALLHRLGARYVAVHLYLYPGSARDDIIDALSAWGEYLRPLSKADEVWLFEIVAWPR